MTTTMDPLRCVGLKQAVLSDDGQTVLLELAMANDKVFPLELDASGVALLTRSLLASARALGRPAPGGAAPDALTVLADAVQMLEHTDGSRSLRVAIGCLDLQVDLPR